MFEESLQFLKCGLDVIDVEVGWVDDLGDDEQNGGSCFEQLGHSGFVKAYDRSRCAEVVLCFWENVCIRKVALPVKTPFGFSCQVCGEDVV